MKPLIASVEINSAKIKIICFLILSFYCAEHTIVAKNNFDINDIFVKKSLPRILI